MGRQSVDDLALGTKLQRQADNEKMALCYERGLIRASLSAESADIPLFTADSCRGVQDVYKSRRHFHKQKLIRRYPEGAAVKME